MSFSVPTGYIVDGAPVAKEGDVPDTEEPALERDVQHGHAGVLRDAEDPDRARPRLHDAGHRDVARAW